MRILAIDQSSRCCGFAIGETSPGGHPPTLLQHGRIISKHADLINRLGEMRSGVRKLMTMFKPECVVMEDIHYPSLKSVKAIYAMAGVGLMCETEARVIMARVEWIAPQTVKGFFGAKDKDGIRDQVQKLFDLKNTQIFDDNHSDALGILVVAGHQMAEAARG